MMPYYTDDAVTIYHADCREVLPTLERVGHVITDPPYSDYVHGKSRRGSDLDDGISRARDFGFDSLDPAVRTAVARFSGGHCDRWAMAFSDVESAGDWRAAFTEWGLEYVRTGAWVKLNCTPQFTGDRPAIGFEAITIAHPPRRKRWNGGGKPALWTFPIVINRSHDDPRLHTAQKPIDLMRALISDFTDPGDLILDPFGGSGTTARAAKDLGRRCILIEREERWAEVAAKRMAQSVLPLEAAR